MILVFWCGVGVAAAEAYVDSVPLPGTAPAPQASTLYYRDGRTILARVGTVNHSDVPLSAVPVPVRQAVLAAEDRDFYEHVGVSSRGIARAAVAVAKGGSQGASTITQQYTRNAFLTQDFSVERKAKEIALAVKLERQFTKDQILERYLNSIYYGRGAYGIAAAAHAYFDVDPKELTLTQGAVLAAVIKDPWNLDPANGATAARDRWAWVLSSMQAEGWLDESTVKAQRYPKIQDRLTGSEELDGPNGLVVDQVERELARQGITSQALHTKGLSVVTTLDPTAQDAALNLVSAKLKKLPKKLRASLVAIDPTSGGIRAYYGGDRGRGYFDDAVAPRSPASTFKPIVLASAMRHGISYLSHWDGTSPREFPGRLGVPLYNHDDLQCSDCTLETSMVQSLNTPFYAVTEQIGAVRVRETAVDLGISHVYDNRPSMIDRPGDPQPGRTRPDISMGRYPVTPVDITSVYATFAAGGVHMERHFVQSATANDGTVLWRMNPQRRVVLDPGIAADVTAVLRSVVDGHRLAPGRPAAGKTGTQQWGESGDNQDAWMVGYTPQLAVSVWLGRSIPGPIRDADGNPIEGETVPAQLWRDFLEAALPHDQHVAFPEAAHVGRVDVGDAKRSTGVNTGTETDTDAGTKPRDTPSTSPTKQWVPPTHPPSHPSLPPSKKPFTPENTGRPDTGTGTDTEPSGFLPQDPETGSAETP